MGYFSNGSEGMDYESQFCENCIHMIPEYGCPCINAHMLWNYEEANNKESLLHKMIPRDQDGFNERCIFYKEDIPEEKENAVYTCKVCGDPCSDICERCIGVLNENHKNRP